MNASVFLENGMTPAVSVIIPVYNSAPWLRRCLESLKAQTFRNFEAVLVDDGSTDESAEILAEYAREDNRFHVLRQENRGAAIAKNLALDYAAGQWITFLDSDDALAPDALTLFLNAIWQADAQVCFGSYVFINEIDGGSRQVHMPQGSRNREGMLEWFYCDPVWPCQMCSGMFRRELFSELRFPDVRHSEDSCLLLQVLSIIKRGAFTDTPVYERYWREGSTSQCTDCAELMDVLWSLGESARFTRENFPQYIGDMALRVQNNVAWLMVLIDRAGRHRHPLEWERAVTAFSQAVKDMARGNLFHRVAASLFGLSPVFFVKCCRIYQFLMTLFRRVRAKCVRITMR